MERGQADKPKDQRSWGGPMRGAGMLDNAVIQVKSGGGKGLTSQVMTKTPRGTDLPVIGYGPDLKGECSQGNRKSWWACDKR